MPRARTNGVGIHFQTVGNGPDVVMVHGLAATLAFWYLRAVPALRRRFRVTTFDLRGHGLSDMPAAGYTSADMAADLDGLLRELGIGEAHVIGHSFGGAVGLQLAALAPTRVRTLTLADAIVPSLQPLPGQGAVGYWRHWRERIQRLGVEVPDDLPHVVYGLVEELARNGRADPCARPFPVRPELTSGSRAARRWRILLESTTALADFAEPAGLTPQRIRGIETPVLAVYGQASYCLPTHAELATLLPRCISEIVTGAGHFHPVLQPDSLLRYLHRFLHNHDRSAVTAWPRAER